MPADLAVIDDPSVAGVALDRNRRLLLESLAAEPGSAAALAARLDLPRQRVGYQLNALQEHGLVVEVDRRRHGGITERVLGSAASSFVVSPAALGRVGADPRRIRDRLSSSYLIALAARAVREVGDLVRRAEAADKTLPTLSIDADIRFRSAADRAEFADALAASVRSLAARYHDESAPQGRWHRVVAFVHPRPEEEPATP